KVGMMGGSYVGATQMLAAIAHPPHLAGICPVVTGSNYHENWTYHGGALEQWFDQNWTTQLATNTLWRLIEQDTNALVGGPVLRLGQYPLFNYTALPAGAAATAQIAPYYLDWLAHPSYDAYWKQWSIEEHFSDIQVPALHIGGWYDIFLGGTLRNYIGIRAQGAAQEARQGQKLLIGPWQHGASRGPGIAGDHYFGLGSDPQAIDLDGLLLRWFDYWLKGIDNGIMHEPPVRIFVMGDNVWRDEQAWPLARAQAVRYYL